MPASMMMADVLSSNPKVSGSRSAMDAVGPMPGSTPTAVPSATPSRQNRMLCRASAWVKPSARLSRSSISPTQPVAEERQAQLQRQHEDDPGQDGEPDRRDDRPEPGDAAAGERREQHRAEDRRDDAQTVDRQGEEDDRPGDHHDGPPL